MKRYIFIIFLLINVLSYSKVLNKVLARVGDEIITERDIKAYYSLFFHPAQKPYFNKEVESKILDNVIKLKALKQYLSKYYIKYDKKQLQNYAKEMERNYRNYFSSEIDYLILLKLIGIKPEDVSNYFFEYFSTSKIFDEYIQNKLREEKKIEVKEIPKTKYQIIILSLNKKYLKDAIKSILKHKDLIAVAKELYGKGYQINIASPEITNLNEIDAAIAKILPKLTIGEISIPIVNGEEITIVELKDKLTTYTQVEKKYTESDIIKIRQNILNKALESIIVKKYE